MKLRLHDRGSEFHYRYIVISDEQRFAMGAPARWSDLWLAAADFCREHFGEPGGGAESRYAVMDIQMILFKNEPEALMFCMEFLGR